MLLSELAKKISAELITPTNGPLSDIEIKDIAPIESAKENEITFIANQSYSKFVETTKAAAIIASQKYSECKKPLLLHKNPYAAYAVVSQIFHKPEYGSPGVSDLAFIAPDAELGKNAVIYPFAYVEIGSFSAKC